MFLKRFIALILIVTTLTILSGCGDSQQSSLPKFSQLQPYISEISEVVFPNRGIIALGEATHGNKEFTLLKLEVFKNIVEQSNIRAFVIEGDFGGSPKVNQYIQNGEGTAYDAASEIGFAIYRTEEMTRLLNWIYEFEMKYYDSDGIFITGHNGHIGKTNATIGTEKSMGQILSEKYEEEYYSIGTEFNSSQFLAPDDSGERKEFSIQNNGDNRLSVLLNQSNMSMLYLNLDMTANDEKLYDYVQAKQLMSSIGEYFSDMMAMTEKGYTQDLSPLQTYNAIVFIKSATPSTMIID